MPRTCRTFLFAALLSCGLLRAEARQDTPGRLAGTVMGTTGAGLPATTVWVGPNRRITQVEISQLDAAQKALELAELKLRDEQTRFVQGASVVRFVIKQQNKVAQAEIQRTTLELAASLKLSGVKGFSQRTAPVDSCWRAWLRAHM